MFEFFKLYYNASFMGFFLTFKPCDERPDTFTKIQDVSF